jgi:hypothetical protein
MYVSPNSTIQHPALSWNPSAKRRAGAPRHFGRYPRSQGLGQTPQQINSIVTTGASTTLSILAGMKAVIGGVSMAGPVGALIGAGIAAAALVANLIVKAFSGCGETCIRASQDADHFEPLLKQNLAAYLAIPAPRYASFQAAYLNNADTILAALNQACSDPSLQAAGQRCISERLDPNACHWKASPGGWNGTTYTPYGQAGSGDACWNWVIGYRNPIANDPNVVPDPSPFSQVGSEISSAGSSLLQSFGVSPSTRVFGLPVSDLLLPGALILVGFLLPSGKRS